MREKKKLVSSSLHWRPQQIVIHLLSHSLFSLEIMLLKEKMNNSLVAKGVKNSEVLVAKGEPQAEGVLKVI